MNYGFVTYMVDPVLFLKNGEGGFLSASLLSNFLFLLMELLVGFLRALGRKTG